MKNPTLDKKNKQIAELERAVQVANHNTAHYEGRVEELEKRVDTFESRERKTQDGMLMRVEQLEGEIMWMRRLITILTVPAEKLERLDEIKKEALNEYEHNRRY